MVPDQNKKDKTNFDLLLKILDVQTWWIQKEKSRQVLPVDFFCLYTVKYDHNDH